MPHHRTRATIAALAAAAALAGAPPAQADPVDDLLEQFFDPFLNADNAVDWDAVGSPAAWDAFLDPAHWDAATAAFNAIDPTAWFEHLVYTPLHDDVAAWIGSDVGRDVGGFINTLLGSYAIGDGADGTQSDPDGGAGGWLFGDGGDGWDATGGAVGGAGGAAGWFGTGGAGGDGADGAAGGVGGAGGWLLGVGGEGGAGGAGGAGGDGGDASGWLFGVGGTGGDGGDGPDGGRGGDGGSATGLLASGGDGGVGGQSGIGGAATGLPALGGAGGNGGPLGSHGDVGHFGVDPTAPALPDPGGLRVQVGPDGAWLTDATGRVVIMHGVNEVYKAPPFDPASHGFGDDDAAFLAANGVNTVRVGIIWAGVEPEPGSFDEAYLASIAQTVQTLANHGIRSLLDMHQDLYSLDVTPLGDGAPDWAVLDGGQPNPDWGFPFSYANPAQLHIWDSFWHNADAPDGVGLQNHYALMWQYVADYFKGNPDVAGYEIMNEPFPGSQWLPSLFGNPYFEAEQLTPFYNQVDAAIRSVDPHTTVFYEPNVLFGNIVGTTHLGAVDDDNSALAFHDYCLTTSILDPTSSVGCSLWEPMIMGGAAAYAQEHNIPALITEYGNTRVTSSLTDTMDEANTQRYGWLFWDYQRLLGSMSAPPTGGNVDTATVDTLAQPYPQTIAGVPHAWSFSDGTLNFSYSTQMADGSAPFAPGSQTDIAVPAGQYPDGYQVAVTGGHVVSAANAPVLVIASDGAGTVSVVVSPAPAG